MEFGKQPDLSQVDFTLPPDHPATGKMLKASGPLPAEQRKVFIGYTAWTHKEWLGTLYPPAARSQDFLRLYANQFSTIELNTTFYRIPDPATVTRWKESASEGFRFCPKVYQEISHWKQLFNAHEQCMAFIHAVQGFEDRLGPCFLQLPPAFGPAQLPRLENFVHEWPRTVPLAIEFRHEAWFDGNPLAEAAFQLLREQGICAVITDVAGRRDVLHQHLTTPVLMLRLVGNALHETDFSRVHDWAKRLALWFDKGLREAYVFLHQPDCTTIPEFGGLLINTINRECGMNLRPLELFNIEPRQGSLF